MMNDPSNSLNIKSTETLQDFKETLNLNEVKTVETQGMSKTELDEYIFQHDKSCSISNVPISNCNTTTTNTPPAIEGYQRKQRRPESVLIEAAEMVARGATFQEASEKYDIAISTIRFYMVRKGYLKWENAGDYEPSTDEGSLDEETSDSDSII